MNGIGQQAKAYVSPLPKKVMTDQSNVYTKYQIQVLENTCMYVCLITLFKWLSIFSCVWFWVCTKKESFYEENCSNPTISCHFKLLKTYGADKPNTKAKLKHQLKGKTKNPNKSPPYICYHSFDWKRYKQVKTAFTKRTWKVIF